MAGGKSQVFLAVGWKLIERRGGIDDKGRIHGVTLEKAGRMVQRKPLLTLQSPFSNKFTDSHEVNAIIKWNILPRDHFLLFAGYLICAHTVAI